MNIVTNFSSTGYTGQYTTTQGSYTFAGTVTTDADKHIKVLSGDISNTSTSAKVGTFSLYFSSTDSTIQDAITTALAAVRTAIDSDLDL